MKIAVVLCFFTDVAHGANLCYKLGQSVADMTDGLCWLWTQLWLCLKQGTAAWLPQTKAASRKVKNSQPVFFAVLHSQVLITKPISFWLFSPPTYGTQLRIPLWLCFSHGAACFVVWQRKEKRSENIVTFHIIWNLMARWYYISTNFLMIFE